MLTVILAVIICYLVGSVPTAYILVKAVKGIDVRTIGSGNVGATNAGRAIGRWAFVAVLFLDALKGYLPVYILMNYVNIRPDAVLVCAFAILAGHMYSIFLGFKGGGKGVATGLGVFTALAPVPVAAALGVFIVVVAIWRMISAGSIIAALTLALSVTFLYSWPGLSLFTWIIAIIIILKHASNIKRILNGTENKINIGKKS